jgi:Ca-activated chloride channel family protein
VTPPAGLPEPALAFSILGYALRLAEPGALRLLVLVLALAVLGAVALVRRRRALLRAAGPLAPRVAPSANLARPASRLGLSLLGLALLALALARPQCGSRTEIARQHGLDLAVVLDASRSMLAADVKPDRLGRAKLEIASLLDGLGGDRVAVVAFAGDAFVACPLTSDLAAAKLFLRAVEPDALPRQGTALAQALAAARDVLLASESRGREKVVLVVSDGEDHEGGVASAAQALAQDGIRLYALAVGTAAGAPVPPRAGGRSEGEPPTTRLDLATLELVAAAGDGDVYDVSSRDHGLTAFRGTLDRMARADEEGRVTVTYEDRYALAAFPGFFLLLAALLLREARAASERASPAPEGPARWRGASGTTALLALFLAGFSPFRAEEENVRAGNERLRAGDAPGALRAYDAAERAVGSHPEIDFDRGSAAAREGRLDDAKAALGRAAATAPGPLASRALQNLGSALAAAGDRDAAVAAFSDALAKDPRNEDARWNLEVLLRKAGGRAKGSADPQRSSRNEATGGASSRPSASPAPASASRQEEKASGDGKRDEERKSAGDAGRERGAEPSEAREKGGPERGREPLSRQEAEALLDALRARERRMPLFGRERRKERSGDAAKDW